MKRLTAFIVIAIACAAVRWAAVQQPAQPAMPLSKFVPAGAMLYLEAKDFRSLLSDWNASPEKLHWTGSPGYDVFSQSRLYLRLSAAGDQFAVAAGIPPDEKFLSQVAGDHSALAIYDIGKLQLLYITHLESARSMQTALWETRSKFEPRSVGNTTFYVRRDEQSEREVAFAVSGDYLLLATRADLLAGALQLMSAGNVRSVETEPWWLQATRAAKEPGDLRMVLNLEKIVPDGYFRTYWVQQNITDLSQYSAGASDLVRDGKMYTEQRVLIRKSEVERLPSREAFAAAGDLSGIAPPEAGWFETVAAPGSSDSFELLKTKLLEPHVSTVSDQRTAPAVQLTNGETGSGADLETRIDEPVVSREASKEKSALQALIENTGLRASLQVQSTSRDPSGVFVRTATAVALVADNSWNENEVRSALAAFVRPSLTASELGTTWQQRSGYQELDGLMPLLVATRANYLLVANNPALMQALLANLERKHEQQPAQYVAVYRHDRERENFKRLSDVVDRPAAHTDGNAGNEPQFFSGTVASVSGSLGRVARETVIVRSEGDKTRQTVTYEWSE